MTALADDRTLDALDFAVVRDMLARQTTTDAAARAARGLVPTTDLTAVRLEQAATAEMRALLDDAALSLPRTRDVDDAVERAARGATIAAEELREVGFALAAADAAVRRVRSARASVLQARCKAARPLPEVAAAIDRAIGERGEVLDRASPTLARLRRNATAAQEEARERCTSLLRQPRYSKAIQDAVVTVRSGRFVVPVKAEFAGALPGVVHDTSATGHTLFVEPLDALDVNNRLRTIRLEEEHEIVRILAELSALVGARAEQARINLASLADLDFVLARARVGADMRAKAPRIVDQARLRIVDGKHPLLGRRAVPQSARLDDDVQVLIVSGPNMGGKTVTLKLVGLFLAMAYCGLQLPAAEGTEIGAFDYLGCDLGDDQSISQNASTFSARLQRLRTILASAGDRSLVLIDEIASGTDPASGSALALAVIEEFLRRRSHAVVTTHSTELKLFGATTPRVQNASVRFDATSYTPTYELDLGSPGRSLAFPLARSLGLDEALVTRAEMLLSQSERDYDRALQELVEIRSQAMLERGQIERERAAVAHLEADVRRRSEALERERRSFAGRAEDRLGRALREFSAELERRQRERVGSLRAKVSAGQAALLGRVLEEVHRDLGLERGTQHNLANPEALSATGQHDDRPAPIQDAARFSEGPRRRAHAGVERTSPTVRDRVYVETLGSEGDVAEDYGPNVLVAIGPMKTIVPKKELQLVRSAGSASPRQSAATKGGAATLETARNVRAELDVRGKRFVEAQPLVERWIDESTLLGISPLRLIHGKGTGLLGRGLQQYLKGRGGVRDVRYGDADEGGSGVTIFALG